MPLETARDRIEERLVLVYLRAGSGTDACVSGVHIGCIAAGHLTATCSSIPMKRLPTPTNSAAGMTRSDSVGRGSCSEPSPTLRSPSPSAGRPVPVGVLSPADGLAKLYAQHVGPG